MNSLKLAEKNLKGFMAENPRPAQAEAPRPQIADRERKKKTDGEDDEPESLAELLLGFLATDGDPNTPAPRIPSREDYYAAVAQRDRQQPALPDEATR